MMLNRNYRYITLGTFVLLWTYVVLRAIFTSPLHDEVATFFHFIETGRIWGSDAQLDANNHLLNSFLGKISYRLFGESFFMFRLPNVLCFALYFWGIRWLLRPLKPAAGYIALIGITAIPYILEYFAYTRGYGISISCFVWVLIFAQKLTTQFKLTTVAGLYFFAFLAITANISFLTTGCLAVLLVGACFLKNLRKAAPLQLAGIAVLTVLFMMVCKPLVGLSMTMKAAGTLYYGSLDGLWDVTGKTLSRYMLFTDADFLCWVFLAGILALLVVHLRQLFILGLWEYLKRLEAVFAFFFFGLLTLIVLMAEAMQINYPEDRVAMHLAPLLLLLIIATLNSRTIGRKAIYALVLFPVTLIFHLSLSTSVFTPDERMTDDFYGKVKRALTEGSSLSGYPTMQLTWALHERKAAFKNYMHLETTFQPNADVVLVKSSLVPKNAGPGGYRIIAEDREAGYIAYKRTTAFDRKPLLRVALEQAQTHDEFIELARFSVQENWQEKPLLLSVKGTLKRSQRTDIESLVISSAKANGEAFRYEAYDLRWYNGILPDELAFEMTYEITAPDPDEAEFVVYIWNKRMVPMALSNCTVYIYALEKSALK